MKKTLALVLVIIPLTIGSSVYAQDIGTTTSTSTPAAVIPGLTPDSPFYFLDKFIESLQEMLTFNQDAKAKLQMQFAAERVAEIKAMIQNNGPKDKGIQEAQARLEEHTKKASEIIKEEKDAGKDVTELETELKDSINSNDQELEDTIQNSEQDLQDKKDVLEQQIHQAEQTGDNTKIEDLKQQIKSAEQSTEQTKKQAETTREMLNRDGQGEDNQSNNQQDKSSESDN